MSRLLGGDEPSAEFVADSLIAGIFFDGVGAGVAFLILPTLGPVIGITLLMVGPIPLADRFTRLVVNTLVGQVLDRVGMCWLVVTDFVVQGLSPFGYVLGLNPGPTSFDSATAFPLSRAYWDVGSAFAFVGVFSTVTYVTSDGNHGKWASYMRGGQSPGFPAGLAVGGLVIDVFGYATMFVVAEYVRPFAALVTISVPPDVRIGVMMAGSPREMPRFVSADIRIFTVGAVNFIVRSLFSGVLLSTVMLYVTANDISLDGPSRASVNGIMMAVGVVVLSVTTFAVGRYLDRLSNHAVLTLPALDVLTVGSTLLTLVPAFPSMFTDVVPIGVGVSGSNLSLLAYLEDFSPIGDVGKLGGVYSVLGNSGSTLSLLVAVPLVKVVDFRIEYLACIALVVVIGLLVARALYGEAATVPGPELSWKMASGAGRAALLGSGTEVV